VLCNAEIKFKAFLDHALALGAGRIATGHYARVRQVDEGFQLLRGLDPAKDQSYFLHRLNQAQLSRTLFPVGELHKIEVRRLALEIGLPNAKKKDSTGICFIGERPFREFLNRYLPTRPGPILTDDGRRVGEHVGLAFYTLGQRKGIGVGGQKSGSGEAWYVARKDMASNTLWVLQGHEHPWLRRAELVAQDVASGCGCALLAGTPSVATAVRRRAGWARRCGSGGLRDTRHVPLVPSLLTAASGAWACGRSTPPPGGRQTMTAAPPKSTCQPDRAWHERCKACRERRWIAAIAVRREASFRGQADLSAQRHRAPA